MNSSVVLLWIACGELDSFFVSCFTRRENSGESAWPSWRHEQLSRKFLEVGRFSLRGITMAKLIRTISTQSPPRRKVRDCSPAPRTHAGRKQCGLIADSAGKIGSSFPPSTSSGLLHGWLTVHYLCWYRSELRWVELLFVP